MLRNFWNDDCGFLISAELVLVATIVLLGVIIGLIQLEGSIIGELNDVGGAIGSLNQSFSFGGVTIIRPGCEARLFVSGSVFNNFSIDTQITSFFCAAPAPEDTN